MQSVTSCRHKDILVAKNSVRLKQSSATGFSFVFGSYMVISFCAIAKTFRLCPINNNRLSQLLGKTLLISIREDNLISPHDGNSDDLTGIFFTNDDNSVGVRQTIWLSNHSNSDKFHISNTATEVSFTDLFSGVW